MSQESKPGVAREIQFTTMVHPQGVDFIYHMAKCHPDVFKREQKDWHFVEYDAFTDALEVIEFYARRENWDHGIAYAQNQLISDNDIYLHKGHYFYGGKRARAFLRKHKGETNG